MKTACDVKIRFTFAEYTSRAFHTQRTSHTVHDLKFLLANGALTKEKCLGALALFKNEVNRSVRADDRDELCFSHNLLYKQNRMF